MNDSFNNFQNTVNDQTPSMSNLPENTPDDQPNENKNNESFQNNIPAK